MFNLKKNGNALKIGIIVAAVAIIAIILVVVLVTVNKDKNEGGNSKHKELVEVVTGEPEQDEVYDVPVVTADETYMEIWLDSNTTMGFDGGSPKCFAADYSDPSSPVIYMKLVADDGDFGTVTVWYAVRKGITYFTYDLEPGVTYKTAKGDGDLGDVFDELSMFFGKYEDVEKSKVGGEFKFIGTDDFYATGDAYVYERTYDDRDKETKTVWVDVDTGCWVKIEENGEVVFEASDVYTGYDVEFPEFDFANAVNA